MEKYGPALLYSLEQNACRWWNDKKANDKKAGYCPWPRKFSDIKFLLVYVAASGRAGELSSNRATWKDSVILATLTPLPNNLTGLDKHEIIISQDSPFHAPKCYMGNTLPGVDHRQPFNGM